ncbi:Phosphoribosylaminoimidazole-succinocarboxamide synthase, partial [hydrothermal vent metagenome]
ETQDWNKTAPEPHVPADIINVTARKYQEAYELITGERFI